MLTLHIHGQIDQAGRHVKKKLSPTRAAAASKGQGLSLPGSGLKKWNQGWTHRLFSQTSTEGDANPVFTI